MVDIKTMLRAGLVGILSYLLSGCAGHPASTHEERVQTSVDGACQVAAQSLPVAAVDEWSDNDLSFTDVQDFNSIPDPYWTAWVLRLAAEGFADIPAEYDKAMGSPVVEEAFEMNIGGSPAGTADLVASATQGKIEKTQKYRLLETVDDLRLSHTSASLLEYSQALHAKSLAGGNVSSGEISKIRERVASLEVKSGMEVLDVAALVEAYEVLRESDKSFSVDRVRLRELMKNVAPGGTIAPENISTLSRLHALDSSLYNEIDTLRVSKDFEQFRNGWFGMPGAVAPDPQVTFYMHSLKVGGDVPLDVSWGQVGSGWRAASPPSLRATAIWMWISDKCHINLGGERTAEEILSNYALGNPVDLVPLSIIANQAGVDGEYIGYSQEEFESDLESAISTNDAMSAASLYRVGERLSLESDVSGVRIGAQVPVTSFNAHALGVIGLESAAFSMFQELRRGGGVRATLDADSPDIVSTILYNVISGQDDPIDKFLVNGKVCETLSKKNCESSELALIAAVAEETDSTGDLPW